MSLSNVFQFIYKHIWVRLIAIRQSPTYSIIIWKYLQSNIPSSNIIRNGIKQLSNFSSFFLLSQNLFFWRYLTNGINIWYLSSLKVWWMCVCMYVCVCVCVKYSLYYNNKHRYVRLSQSVPSRRIDSFYHKHRLRPTKMRWKLLTITKPFLTVHLGLILLNILQL
jgi:hypothetical protein